MQKFNEGALVCFVLGAAILAGLMGFWVGYAAAKPDQNEKNQIIIQDTKQCKENGMIPWYKQYEEVIVCLPPEQAKMYGL